MLDLFVEFPELKIARVNNLRLCAVDRYCQTACHGAICTLTRLGEEHLLPHSFASRVNNHFLKLTQYK